MEKTRARCLTCFIVAASLLWATCTADSRVEQLHFVTAQPAAGARQAPLPLCPPQPGIHWVRDPTSCSGYFICVASRPIRMAPCPHSTVWSVGARNCVPVHSLWDDCPHEPHPTPQPGPGPSLSLSHSSSLSPSFGSWTRALPTSSQSARNWTAASDSMSALVDPLHPEEQRREKMLRLLPNHPCAFGGEETYLPHPERCHWFYNCSAPLTDDRVAGEDVDGWDALTEECPYPSLFSVSSRSCQHYTDVDCGTRGLFLDPCNYRQHRCQHKDCEPCKQRYGSCVGLDDGLQPHPGLEWTARHLVCQDQRAIHQMDCPQEKPVFSPETRRCENLLDIPKTHGGFQPSCEGRHDGRYPDETGRCDVFYECADNVIQGRFQCPSGTVFHPERQTCRRKNSRGVPPPCGNSSASGRSSLGLSLALCRGLEDGLYADPYGRCPLYYECQQSLLKKYHKCPNGSYFDPRAQRCSPSVSHVPAPCGRLPNPCVDRADGQYADVDSNCQASFRCKRGTVVRQRSCPPDTVFNEGKGSCQLPNDTPPPCGLAPSCSGRADGRYPSHLKGCEFYYTCRAGVFRGYGHCSIEEGGFYFNALTGDCDFPQNVCAPCGVRTENCTVSSLTS